VGRRLILDTNILIAYERGTIDRSTLDDDDLAIASVSVAEYRVGIELADTPERAAQRSRALATIMSVIDVMDYTPVTAAHHGGLLAYVRKSGAARGAHDLIIAAHAAETGRTIVSKDAKARFNDLPGVAAISALSGTALSVWRPLSEGTAAGVKLPAIVQA
jgi:tRNA(fMet)-specific endonuclease VapC